MASRSIWIPALCALLIGAALAVAGCFAIRSIEVHRAAEAERSLAAQVPALEAKAPFGRLEKWRFVLEGDRAEAGAMQDRGYLWCLKQKPMPDKCLARQDIGIEAYYHIRFLRNGGLPNTDLWVERFPQYSADCMRQYRDHGAEDVRVLGDCISARMSELGYTSVVKD